MYHCYKGFNAKVISESLFDFLREYGFDLNKIVGQEYEDGFSTKAGYLNGVTHILEKSSQWHYISTVQLMF